MGGTFRSLHFELLPAQESSLYLAGNTKNKDPTPGVSTPGVLSLGRARQYGQTSSQKGTFLCPVKDVLG